MIPKFTHEEGILENSQLFNSHLEPEDMKLLDSLNENLRESFEAVRWYGHPIIIIIIISDGFVYAKKKNRSLE